MNTEHYEIEFSFDNDSTLTCRGKLDTDKHRLFGQYFGFVYIKNVKWAIVLWDGEDDPDLYKANCLEVAHSRWVTVS